MTSSDLLLNLHSTNHRKVYILSNRILSRVIGISDIGLAMGLHFNNSTVVEWINIADVCKSQHKVTVESGHKDIG